MRTEDVSVEMLTQRTGAYICDSGGTAKYDEKFAFYCEGFRCCSDVKGK